MAVSEEAKQLIEKEKQILSEVEASLKSQRERKEERFSSENRKARELTSELVKTHRDEEKWLLASDEAVSHGVKDKQIADIAVINRLLKQPYFARMVLREEWNGQEKEIEYKIGLAENSECRIIDWRKAPIARLYYEYKEGDEYSEEIQGREREGQIVSRNMVETNNCVLTKLSCRLGNFIFKSSEWETIQSGLHPHAMAAAIDGDNAGGEAQNLLPQIASLLSPAQFALISENRDKAMLIQGIAGSGKTTVALHRLAWMFAEQSNTIEPSQCLILVLSHSLKKYISQTLPSLGVEGVRVITLVEWYEEIISRVAQHLCKYHELDEKFRINRPSSPLPSGIERLKRSMAMLRAIESYVQKNIQNRSQLQSLSPDAILLAVLKNPKSLVEEDETKLITESLVRQAMERALQNSSQQVLDRCDDALLVRITIMLQDGVPFKEGSYGKYEHIFADEVQDFSPVDLACVLGSIKGINHITIVGDTAQKIDEGSTFPGWDKLRKHWSAKETLSKFVNLDLSYRSTVEILKFADHIQQSPGARRSEGRHGRAPIWFKCLSEQRGVQSACDWLNRAMEKYPSTVTAVVCRDATQAKYVLTLLKPTFGPAIRLGDETGFSFEGGIVVTHASQVRGLEFTNLLIWNPSKKDYPADDTHRNLLYLVVSRTRENLCIVTWTRQSDILPPLHSPLIRAYDIAREELEALEEEKKRAET